MTFLKKIRNKINRILAPLVFRLFRVKKIKNNKIVVMNYNGKGYGDNAKYIVNELLKTPEKYDIVYVTNDVRSLPENIRSVSPKSLKWIYELSTAKIWINNTRFNLYVRKRKEQFYIQTWHSSLRLKKIEMDAVDKLGKYYKRMMKFDSKNINLMIVGSEFSFNTYRNAFLYNGNIERIGTPRCDLFFNKDICNGLIKKIFKAYGIAEKKKVVLYAPTFRRNQDINEAYMDIEYVQDKLGKDYVLMVRFHPNTNLEMKSDNLNVIDVTSYPDMQELLCAVDVLITDYSGCCFDMMIANKPCILFVKDIEEYLSKERGVYFTMDELPFPKVKKEDELVEIIKKNDYNAYFENIRNFDMKIGLYEKGNASKNLKNIIDDVIDGRRL